MPAILNMDEIRDFYMKRLGNFIYYFIRFGVPGIKNPFTAIFIGFLIDILINDFKEFFFLNNISTTRYKFSILDSSFFRIFTKLGKNKISINKPKII